LSFILDQAGEKHAVAVWRLPGSDITQVIITDRHVVLDPDDFLEELDPGFLVAPFNKSEKRLFLKGDRIFSFQNGVLQSPAGPGEETSAQWLADALSSYEPRKYTPSDAVAPSKESSKDEFLRIVSAGIQEIEQGTFEKIVPARARQVELGAEFDIIASFEKLCSAYPQALISYVSIPGFGNWLGASPELLVSVEDKRIFKTVALAGTLPYQPGIDLKSVAWTQKEIEEQALVERYVISCFKRVRLREYEEHGPKTAVAGNLMHLKSEFTVDMKATNFPQIGSVMLDLLHPTSAVCGMPLEPSLNFLNNNESHERRFYAGYLGPVNVHNNIELFVNIRCMQISGTRATLYAGAGVTIDSVPEKEWNETEMKLNTLLNVIL